MKNRPEHAVGYRTALFFGACMAAALLAGQAHASGDESAPPKPNCPKGQVWDTKTGKCVLQTSKATSDADRTDYAYRLAKELHVPLPRINDVVRGKRSISADTALRLGIYFGHPAQFWLNLQNDYDLRLAHTAELTKVKPRIAA